MVSPNPVVRRAPSRPSSARSRRTLRRGLALVPIAAALAVGGSLASASAATAAPVETKIVTWSVPAGLGDRYASPQVLAQNSSGCGDFQVDTYRYDTPQARATVDGLIAKGTVASAGEDGPVYLSSTDVSNICDAQGRVISTANSGSAGSGTADSATDPSAASGILAFTGSDSAMVNMLAAGGVVLIAGGLVVFGIRRFVVDGE